MKLLVPILSSVLFCLAPSPARPADQPDPPVGSTIRQTIVVTPAAKPESIEETPAAVTVITAKELADREVRDVADALREVPGIVVSRTGSPGKAASIFTRGGNSTHTLVLWNGIELNNPYFSGYDWGRFSVSGVERIEVVRGPYSALYGSEAVSGVINILTGSGGTGATIDVQGGERGLVNASLAGSYSDGSYSGVASVEHRDDDGFAPNDDFRQDSALAGVTWSPSQSLSLGIESRFTSYDLGIPTVANAEGTAFVPSPDRRQKGDEFQLAVPFRIRIGGLDYALTLSRSSRDDDFADPDDPFFLTSSSTRSVSAKARLTARRDTFIGSVTLGGEYERASVDDTSSYGVNLDGEKRSSKSLFVEDRLTIPTGAERRLELVAGLRLDDFDTFGSEISPRLAAGWLAGANKFRAAYGRSFRAPSIGELYFPFFGNVGLDAERGSSYELGFDRFLPGDGILSVTLFRNDFENLIVYDNASFRFENTGAATTQGVEVGVRSTLGQHLSAGLSYTLLDTEQKETGETLLRRPKNSGSVSLGYALGRWRGIAVARYNGEQTDITDLLPYGRVSDRSFTVVDATLQYRAGRLTPYLRVENLTDARYQEVFGYPSPRRRLLAGIRVDLH